MMTLAFKTQCCKSDRIQIKSLKMDYPLMHRVCHTKNACDLQILSTFLEKACYAGKTQTWRQRLSARTKCAI